MTDGAVVMAFRKVIVLIKTMFEANSLVHKEKNKPPEMIF
jgi:hypothetical protein